MVPTIKASSVVSSAVQMPMMSEIRRPAMVRAKMSRPFSLTPNQWYTLGPVRAFRRSRSNGLYW
jgi:hypothetical protein